MDNVLEFFFFDMDPSLSGPEPRGMEVDIYGWKSIHLQVGTFETRTSNLFITVGTTEENRP